MKKLIFLTLIGLPVIAKHYSFDDLKSMRESHVVGLADSFLVECGEKTSFISAVLAKLDQPPYLSPNLRSQLKFYFGDLKELLKELSQDSEQLNIYLMFLHQYVRSDYKERYIQEKVIPLLAQLKELKVYVVQLQNIIRMHTW